MSDSIANFGFSLPTGVQSGFTIALICTSLGWVLWKIRKGHFLGEITEEVRICLRKSSAFAGCTLGLGSIPVFAFRRLGWEVIKPLYNDFLFKNAYITVLTVIGTVSLAALAILFPIKQNKKLKYQLWIASCLSVGTLLAPIVLTPRDILTAASGYVIGLTLPAAITCAFATNFLFLNVVSFLTMSICTIFMHSTAIPWIINRRNIASGIVSLVPVGVSTSMILPFIVGSSLLMMLHMNLFVWFVKECHEKKKIQPNKPATSIFHIDATDEITNGMIIASYVVYTFLKVWWEMMRLFKRSVTELIRKGSVREALEDK